MLPWPRPVAPVRPWRADLPLGAEIAQCGEDSSSITQKSSAWHRLNLFSERCLPPRRQSEVVLLRKEGTNLITARFQLFAQRFPSSCHRHQGALSGRAKYDLG